MQKLSTTTKKQTVKTTPTELKYSKSQFEKDFPLICINNGEEHRRGETCPVGYYDSEANRREKYNSEESLKNYYDSPEFAVEWDRMKYGCGKEAIRKKKEESEALEILGLTVDDYTKTMDSKRRERDSERVFKKLEYVQEYVQGFLAVGREDAILYLHWIDHVKNYIQYLKSMC
jgi:hypothetical protein